MINFSLSSFDKCDVSGQYDFSNGIENVLCHLLLFGTVISAGRDTQMVILDLCRTKNLIGSVLILLVTITSVALNK